MKDIEIPELCIEWELLNRRKNPITKRKIKKNGPTYKILKDVCKKESELFFPKNQKKQKINKIRNPDIFQKRNIACKKHILESLTRADIQTRPPQHVQESTSDPFFSTRSDAQTQTCDLKPLDAQVPLMLPTLPNHLDRLKHLHENGYLWDKSTCASAARNGRLDCLKYAHENGCQWDKSTCASAARNGHLDCLKYAHENGCSWDTSTCAYAAANGRLDCLKYLHENGCPWDEDTCAFAARNGHLDCLKYAHENGCPWDNLTCALAAKHGQLDCLNYLHENGYPWDKYICALAATNGYLDCLNYAHENGCPWDELTCAYAAKNGHIDCLKYAHENGCPWDEDTCKFADENGHLDCLYYAHENGCPCIHNRISLLQETKPSLEFTEHTKKICLPQNITKDQLKNISEEISGVLSTNTNDWPKKVSDILSPYERTQNVCLPKNITREQLKHITDEISGVVLNNKSNWIKGIEDIFYPYLTNYQNLKTRIQEAIKVCTYLNKTVSIADQQWCVSGPDKQIFNTYIGSFNVLSSGTFGIVSKVYFKNLRTPVIIKEAKFFDEDNQATTVKTIEGRFELQKKGKKDYFSLENLILEAIDRLILQPHKSPNFLLFYETTWCKNCNMVDENKNTFGPGSCYLTFMEAADTDLYRLELPSIYQQESVLYQILLGLHSLQKYLGLWHRDIKTDNIFIKQIQPGGVLKYNVDNEIYYVQNTGYIVYVSDFNVADCLKPDVLTKEYHSALQYCDYFHPCWIKYVNNQLVGVPLLNYFNKQTRWTNSKNQKVDLIPNPIPSNDMDKDPIQFPFYNFFGDIQDVIRMFTGGKRSEIALNQVTVKPELDEMYSRLMKAEAYIKKLPRITTKCVKYLLAKEMLKSLYKPPIKNSGKFRVIEEFTL
jgi:hypothetical protein